MEVLIVVLLVGSVAVLAIALRLLGLHRSRGATGDRHPDSDLHRRRAEAAAETEEHDIDDMIDAIAERQRRSGRRDIGEELSDELMRGRWERE